MDITTPVSIVQDCRRCCLAPFPSWQEGRRLLHQPEEADVLKKPITILLLIGLYLLVFVGLNVGHFWYVPVTVVLYAALLDAALAATLVAALVFAMRQQQLSATVAEITLALCVGFLIAVIYSIMIPTLVDRSLSVYMLEKLHQYEGGIKQDAIADVIKNDYFDERRVIDARLTEQLNSGTIAIKNGCIRLTPRGEFVARLTQLYRKVLLPKQREIRGTISSDFAPPLQGSAPAALYACN